MSNKWIHDPPCEAELYLDNLFSSKKIESKDTACKIQSKYPIFKVFSPAVFRNNFKRLRDRHGLSLMNSTDGKVDDEDQLTPPKKMKTVNIAANNSVGKLRQLNEPFLQATFERDSSLDEYITILVPLYSGSTNIRFEIAEDGLSGCVKYNWPKTMHNFAKLFKNENGKDNTCIIALQKQLAKHRNSHSEIPEGIYEFDFPFPVQGNEKIIMGYTDEEDGCKMLKIEIPAIKKFYGKLEEEVKF